MTKTEFNDRLVSEVSWKWLQSDV